MPDRESVVKNVVTPENARKPLIGMAKIPYCLCERDAFGNESVVLIGSASKERVAWLSALSECDDVLDDNSRLDEPNEPPRLATQRSETVGPQAAAGRPAADDGSSDGFVAERKRHEKDGAILLRKWESANRPILGGIRAGGPFLRLTPAQPLGLAGLARPEGQA